MAQSSVKKRVTLNVENIGGIDHTNIEFDPGVAILTGRNATNRTSLLKAIMAALGSSEASLKADSDQGQVELNMGEETYTRHLSSQNGATVMSGDPYLEDAKLADLFAFLLETNESRQAVTRSEDLRDIIMQPIDTADIKRQIDKYTTERDNLDQEIADIDDLKQELPDLKDKKAELVAEESDKKEELGEVEGKISEIDRGLDDKEEENQKREKKFEELNEAREELENVRHQIETHKDSIEALREEREELREEQQEHEEPSDDQIENIEAQIQQLRQQKDALNGTINQLQTVIEFNQSQLDDSANIFEGVSETDTANGESVAERLSSDTNELTCWTCGNDTSTSQIEAMVDDLNELRDQYMKQRRELTQRVDELTDQRSDLKERQRKQSELTERLETIAEEIDRRESRIANLEERRDELTEKVESLESAVEQLQGEQEKDSKLLELHKQANQLEVELDRLKTNIENTEDRISNIEERLAEQNELAAQRDEIQKEIEELRTRVDRLEAEAVEQFNEHMEAVLDILAYENLERIWIERTEQEVKRGREKVIENRFDLHIVRATDEGKVYEDTVDHLSESERKVTGLVFALAGYLVHDVAEKIPFMLIDSVEAIDAPRLSALIDYFQDHAGYLVVALLEEDAKALDDSYQRIIEI